MTNKDKILVQSVWGSDQTFVRLRCRWE